MSASTYALFQLITYGNEMSDSLMGMFEFSVLFFLFWYEFLFLFFIII